jgi:transcription termination factor Rho
MQDLSTLESKSLAELREIGKAFGITDTTLKKKELLNAIIGKTMPNNEEENTPEPAAEEAPRKRAVVRV